MDKKRLENGCFLKGLNDFESYFPKYTWQDQHFKIIYKINDNEISIKREKSKEGKASIELDYSKTLVSLHKKLKSAYKKELKKFKESEEIKHKDRFTKERLKNRDPFIYFIEKNVYSAEISKNFKFSLFIPASRSFFANLQKNVFSFLTSNIDIDPFLSQFGSQYETAKRFHDPFEIDSNPIHKLKKKVDALIKKILAGKYKYENEQDWIVSKIKKINLINASSGQQEALPMLLILAVWPFFASSERKYTFL